MALSAKHSVREQKDWNFLGLKRNSADPRTQHHCITVKVAQIDLYTQMRKKSRKTYDTQKQHSGKNSQHNGLNLSIGNERSIHILDHKERHRHSCASYMSRTNCKTMETATLEIKKHNACIEFDYLLIFRLKCSFDIMNISGFNHMN